MSLSIKLNPALEKLPVYLPGRPIEEVARELGLDPQNIIKMASNENPLGPSPKAVEAMKSALQQVNLYPDGNAFYLRNKLSRKLNLPMNYITLGNGSNELLELIAHAVLMPGVDTVMSQYCFAVYPIVTRLSAANPIIVPAKNYGNDLDAMLKAITPNTRIIFLANPNNPTGTLLTQKELEDFLAKAPKDVLVVIDEAYTEYQDTPPDFVPAIHEGKYENLVICRTFSKIYGLAGLRIGFAVAVPEFIAALEKVREPFNTSLLAQLAAAAALDDDEYLDKIRKMNKEGQQYLQKELKAMNVEFVPSITNFLLVKVGNGTRVFEALQKQGIIIRPVNNYQLPEWVRITVGTMPQNERLIAELKKVL
ncbi:MAG: histidinol-phosphate transaminase [Verrucomicrobia bacterium]|nr:histidinol-phosphate transaminase [Verrucomicrobiota bacterium]